MIDYSALIDFLAKNPSFSKWAQALPEHIAHGLSTQRYGDLPAWYHALSTLPPITTRNLSFAHQVSIGGNEQLEPAQRQTLLEALQSLSPWRKGPLQLFGITIDAEWRCDQKWQRLAQHISPLQHRTVLDVGCGNGYYCWRMLGGGAQRVIGIDPSPRFVLQFYMCKHFTTGQAVDVLPLTLEDLPENLQGFDTTFSMGVLYHRRSPMDHLRQLKNSLKPGGELVLETLIIDGKLGEVLVPEGRYAMMNNVWFLPSVLTLESWLRKCGYRNIRCISVNQTSTNEQRSTAWMQFQSLKDFLQPGDFNKTAEGHSAPKRAIIIAEKPS
ncbi:MAG: tRNA 5-methoxyuridine(34)/uridine 5-oxyacetic acid(34) synthase CmoB [Cellvibrionaceae bacterium]|nr:tRNA 5-methoxyuridine(34)/uridine 5-oxyacetic acid(34) synthase CmoB [Cellvibrionaceae bacterium]